MRIYWEPFSCHNEFLNQDFPTHIIDASIDSKVLKLMRRNGSTPPPFFILASLIGRRLAQIPRLRHCASSNRGRTSFTVIPIPSVFQIHLLINSQDLIDAVIFYFHLISLGFKSLGLIAYSTVSHSVSYNQIIFPNLFIELGQWKESRKNLMFLNVFSSQLSSLFSSSHPLYLYIAF